MGEHGTNMRMRGEQQKGPRAPELSADFRPARPFLILLKSTPTATASSPKCGAEAQSERDPWSLAEISGHMFIESMFNDFNHNSVSWYLCNIRLPKRPVLPRTRLSFVACLELFGSLSELRRRGHPDVVPLGGSLKSIIAKALQ